MYKIGIIIQARTQSNRLGDKTILPFYNNKSILEIIIKNISEVYPLANIVIATTTNKEDDRIEYLANTLGVGVYRGDENNVLKRYIDCASYKGFDTVVRVCSDNPFLNVNYLSELIEVFEQYNCDYLSYEDNGIPVIKTHWGLFTEIVTLDALKKVQTTTSEKKYIEHVTNYVYSTPSSFNCKFIKLPKELQLIANDQMRFTVDDKIDFEIMQEIYRELIQKTQDVSEISSLLMQKKDLKLRIQSQYNKYKK